MERGGGEEQEKSAPGLKPESKFCSVCLFVCSIKNQQIHFIYCQFQEAEQKRRRELKERELSAKRKREGQEKKREEQERKRNQEKS